MFSEGGKEPEEGDRAGRESQDAAPEVAVPFGRREIVSPRAFAHPLLLSCFLVLSPAPQTRSRLSSISLITCSSLTIQKYERGGLGPKPPSPARTIPRPRTVT